MANRSSLAFRNSQERGGIWAYTADDVLVISKVRLAVLAAVDLAAVEIGIVRQPHDCIRYGFTELISV